MRKESSVAGGGRVRDRLPAVTREVERVREGHPGEAEGEGRRSARAFGVLDHKPTHGREHARDFVVVQIHTRLAAYREKSQASDLLVPHGRLYRVYDLLTVAIANGSTVPMDSGHLFHYEKNRPCRV